MSATLAALFLAGGTSQDGAVIQGRVTIRGDSRRHALARPHLVSARRIA